MKSYYFLVKVTPKRDYNLSRPEHIRQDIRDIFEYDEATVSVKSIRKPKSPKSKVGSE